jgi:hypothetical protein
MATKLFVSPAQVKQTTIIGGNVDDDKFVFAIESVQITVIEPLLGTELFDKMINDLTFPITYTGLYLDLYEKFIFPITKFESAAQYINFAQYTVGNGGIFKHSPENSEVVDRAEISTLTDTYHNNAQPYIKRFNKWICKNTIPEYKTWQDEVNADKSMTLRQGWHFGTNYRNTGTTDYE